MKHRLLQNADIALSEIALGCASYWGKKHFSAAQAFDVVHQAVASGINYFDTGHSYSNGNAEIRLGKALENHDKSQLFISSKAGTRVGNFARLYKDFSPEWLRSSCELSLKRLKTDHLPLFFLHGPNPEDFNEATFATLEKLKVAGKIGLCGVNSFNDHIIDLAVKSQQFQLVMLDYNLLTQHRLSTIKKISEQGVDVIVAGGLGGGFYQQGFKRITSPKKMWYWLRALKNHRKQLTQSKKFAFLNHQETASAVQLALAFVLRESAIKSTLIGTTSTKHLKELVQATDLELSAQLLQQIEQAV